MTGPGIDQAQKRRVLVVDDNAVNRRVLALMVKKWGAEVDLAENGKEAVEAVQRALPDLILMDLSMPVMDGFEAVEQIRLDHVDGLPIIAVSANLTDAVRERVERGGFDGFIPKPVDAQKMRAQISPYLMS